MLRRTLHLDRVKKLLKQFPVVAILGARQVGKTTLARELQRGWNERHAFDLQSSLRRPRWRALVRYGEKHSGHRTKASAR
jgi:predicted AAA+ superfamily ATPase